MKQSLSLVTLGVADVARSRGFYERLGWKASGASVESTAFFQAGGVVLSLWGRESVAEDANLPLGNGFGGVVLAHNVRTRAEVDAVLAEAKAAGGHILRGGRDAVWGGYTGCFADPDGHPWEVAWNPHWTIAENGSLRLPP
jgi:catechol 2,3-dioxygenase-like lactoylglutathione lyase family enzyme